MILRRRLTAEAKERGDVLVRAVGVSMDRRGNVRLDARRCGYAAYNPDLDCVPSIVTTLKEGDLVHVSEASLKAVLTELKRDYPEIVIWLRG